MVEDTGNKSNGERERIDVLKFYYEMYQNEINKNSDRAFLYKGMMIPIALGALGFAIQINDEKFTAFAIVSGFIALLLVLSIDLRFTYHNDNMIAKQRDIELVLNEKLKDEDIKGLRGTRGLPDYTFPLLQPLFSKISASEWRVNEYYTLLMLLFFLSGLFILIYQKFL